MLEYNKIYQGDCLEIMKDIDDKSVDMILCDLPYGSTKCKWDTPIDLPALWKEYNRVCKPNTAILLFGAEPFSSVLRNSNLKMYHYDYYWHKTKFSNFLNGKKQPFFKIETISVFYKKQPTYNPKLVEGEPYTDLRKKVRGDGRQQSYGPTFIQNVYNTGWRYPDNLLEFPNGSDNKLHPTQKPLALCEYLIKTFTNEGMLVPDNCCGSGTTCLAARNLGRNYIGIEQDQKYVEVANDRLRQDILWRLSTSNAVNRQ